MFMAGVTWSNSVPPRKNPPSLPGTCRPRPSTTSVAPQAWPSSM
ncbi:Uncharacterised protein [Bordetella pertussis]|nr:Uncharacterised protein [Bordetella pertussis]CFW30864.1 Uncharacterised protein [Bordetella pertussis]